MAMLNTQPRVLSFQSSGAEWVTPIAWLSGMLKTLNAYACPIERWMARAAGGTSQRLKPGGATVLLRSRKESAAMRGDLHGKGTGFPTAQHSS